MAVGTFRPRRATWEKECAVGTATIPINLTFEAACHVVRLGCWAEFEAMIERVRETIDEARAITVWLDTPTLPQDEYRILICAEVVSEPVPFDPWNSDPRESQLDAWVQATFPESVARHFIPMVVRGYTEDEG
jgi:hypothetical protein